MRTFINVGIIFILSGALMACLFLASRSIRREQFIRLFPSHPLLDRKTIDLGYNSFYIAGTSTSKVYLANLTAPGLIIEYNTSLSDSSHLGLTFAASAYSITSDFTCMIDSPHVYLIRGTRPAYFYGTITDRNMLPYDFKATSFDAMVLAQPGSIFVRTFDTGARQNIIKRIMLKGQNYSNRFFAPEAQGDGVFSIDGSLNYDAVTGKVFYVYYYQNQFVCLDSNVQLNYRARTIDTNRTAKISLSTVYTSDHSNTSFNTPPKTVNNFSCTDGSYLYIQSSILSAKENQENWKHNVVIDVYYLKNGTYKFSFYLPKETGRKLQGFRVVHKKLIALYENILCSYNVNF